MKISKNCDVRQNFSQKSRMKNYFWMDPSSVILAWVQSWNNSEKLDETVMSEQLLFMWSTFRDSSIGTKLKYFWRAHETVKSTRIFSQKHVSWTITFHVMQLCDSSIGTKFKYLKKTMKVYSPPEFFHKNMSHEQLFFTWSIFRDSSMWAKLKYFWKTHESV